MTQKNLLIALITLIVAIFVFAQVYILFTVSQVSNQLVQMEARLDKRISGLRSEMNQRLSDMAAEIRDVRSEVRQLNQNYANHLAHHTGQGERK